MTRFRSGSCGPVRGRALLVWGLLVAMLLGEASLAQAQAEPMLPDLLPREESDLFGMTKLDFRQKPDDELKRLKIERYLAAWDQFRFMVARLYESVSTSEMVHAAHAVVDAQMALTESDAERLRLLEQHVKNWKIMEDVHGTKSRQGEIPRSDYAQVKVQHLTAQIAVLEFKRSMKGSKPTESSASPPAGPHAQAEPVLDPMPPEESDLYGMTKLDVRQLPDDELKRLKVQRYLAAWEQFRFLVPRFRERDLSMSEMVRAAQAVVDAQLAITESDAERLRLLEQNVNLWKVIEGQWETMAGLGVITRSDYVGVRAQHLTSQIAVLEFKRSMGGAKPRESSSPSPAGPQAQAEPVPDPSPPKQPDMFGMTKLDFPQLPDDELKRLKVQRYLAAWEQYRLLFPSFTEQGISTSEMARAAQAVVDVQLALTESDTERLRLLEQSVKLWKMIEDYHGVEARLGVMRRSDYARIMAQHLTAQIAVVELKRSMEKAKPKENSSPRAGPVPACPPPAAVVRPAPVRCDAGPDIGTRVPRRRRW